MKILKNEIYTREKKISINKKTTKNIKILKNEIYAMKKTRFHYNKKKKTPKTICWLIPIINIVARYVLCPGANVNVIFN